MRNIDNQQSKKINRRQIAAQKRAAATRAGKAWLQTRENSKTPIADSLIARHIGGGWTEKNARECLKNHCLTHMSIAEYHYSPTGYDVCWNFADMVARHLTEWHFCGPQKALTMAVALMKEHNVPALYWEKHENPCDHLSSARCNHAPVTQAVECETEASEAPVTETEATPEAVETVETPQPASGHVNEAQHAPLGFVTDAIAIAEAALQTARESLEHATAALAFAKTAALGLPVFKEVPMPVADDAASVPCEAAEATDSGASDTMEIEGLEAANDATMAITLLLTYTPARLLGYTPAQTEPEGDSVDEIIEPEPRQEPEAMNEAPKRRKAGRPRKNPLAAFSDADLIRELLSRGYDVINHIPHNPHEMARPAVMH